jgi:hypothetical protein
MTPATTVALSLKIRMRGTSDTPCSRWTREQITSQVRQPMHKVGSGMITPEDVSNSCGVGRPLKTLTPPTPIAATATNPAPAWRMKSRRDTTGCP